jgi:hypothetical protein
LDAGAVKLTVAWALPPTAVPIVGAPATAPGIILLDAAEAGLIPIALVAVTVNVYTVPFVNPGTMIGLAAPVAVMPPGLDVTV